MDKGHKICRRCTQNAISKQTIAIKIFFFSVLEFVIKKLIELAVDPEEILATLPEDIASKLRSRGVSAVEDIFKENGPLDDYLNWYDFRVLTTIVKTLGDNECKKELDKYNENLGNYLVSRIELIQINAKKCPEIMTESKQDKTEENQEGTEITVHLMIDSKWELELVEKGSPHRDYIASLLGTRRNHLHFSTPSIII